MSKHPDAGYLQEIAEILPLKSLYNNIVRGKVLEVTTSTADTDVEIEHGLEKIPTGFVVIGKDKPADIYNGSTSSTIENLYIRASVESVNLKLLAW